MKMYTCIDGAHKRVIGFDGGDLGDWSHVKLSSNAWNNTLSHDKHTSHSHKNHSHLLPPAVLLQTWYFGVGEVIQGLTK